MKQTLVKLVIDAALSLVVLAPYWFMNYWTPDGGTPLVFTTPLNNFDQMYNFDVFHQGYHGALLRTNHYTPESPPEKILIPFYSLAGNATRILGLDPGSGFLLLRFFSLFFLVRVTRRFVAAIKSMSSDLKLLPSTILFVLILFTGQFLPFSYIDTNLFISAYVHPHTAVTCGVLLICATAIFRYDTRRLAAGLIYLSIFHPYMAIPVLLLYAAWAILDKGHLRALVFPLLSTVPGWSYHFFASFKNNYLLDRYGFESGYVFPNPIISLGLFGLPFYISLYFWVTTEGRALLKRDRLTLYLSLWFLSLFCASFLLPVYFARRFALVTQTPLILLSLILVLKKFKSRYLPITRVLTAVFIFPALIFLFLQYYGPWKDRDFFYLNTADTSIIKKLHEEYTTMPVLMGSERTGVLYPPFAGCRVFSSGWWFTSYREEKRTLIRQFYHPDSAPAFRKQILEKYHIDYVLLGPRERALVSQPIRELNVPFLHPVLSVGETILYRFNP